MKRILSALGVVVGITIFGCAGVGPPSSINGSNTKKQDPGAPINLVAVGVATNEIDLTWSAPLTGGKVTGYYVKRFGPTTDQMPISTNGFIQIGTTPVGVTNYNDTSNLIADTNYWYYTQAYN